MDINTNFSRDVDNLLQNEEFIKWRLFRTEELEEYWENFRKENPHNEDVLQEAISRFEAVKINYYPISDTEKKTSSGKLRIVSNSIRDTCGCCVPVLLRLYL
jgi:transmembrane sensor